MTISTPSQTGSGEDQLTPAKRQLADKFLPCLEREAALVKNSTQEFHDFTLATRSRTGFFSKLLRSA
jgi:hypothetical protein